MKHSKKGSRGPRLYFSHFQNRILCAFLLCTLIPIFIIGGISYAVSYNIAKDKILNASISADAQLHTQFDNRLQQGCRILWNAELSYRGTGHAVLCEQSTYRRHTLQHHTLPKRACQHRFYRETRQVGTRGKGERDYR